MSAEEVVLGRSRNLGCNTWGCGLQLDQRLTGKSV